MNSTDQTRHELRGILNKAYAELTNEELVATWIEFCCHHYELHHIIPNLLTHMTNLCYEELNNDENVDEFENTMAWKELSRIRDTLQTWALMYKHPAKYNAFLRLFMNDIQDKRGETYSDVVDKNDATVFIFFIFILVCISALYTILMKKT